MRWYRFYAPVIFNMPSHEFVRLCVCKYHRRMRTRVHTHLHNAHLHNAHLHNTHLRAFLLGNTWRHMQA